MLLCALLVGAVGSLVPVVAHAQDAPAEVSLVVEGVAVPGFGGEMTPLTSGQPPPSAAFAGQLAAGGAHVCGVLEAGGVGCWDRDTEGQSTPPTAVATASTVTLLASGWLFSCAQLTPDGAGTCWGFDDEGQSTGLPGLPLTAMALGQGFGVGLQAVDGAPICWGRSDVCDTIPTDAGTAWTDLQAGADFACGLADTGEAKFRWPPRGGPEHRRHRHRARP